MNTESRYKQIARWLTIGAACAPILVIKTFFFPFITGKALFFRTAVELALLSYILHLVLPTQKKRITISEELSILKHPIAIALIVFGTLALITPIFALNPSFAFWSNFERAEGAWQILHYILFFVLVLLLFRTKKDWLLVGKISVAISLIVSCYALFQISTLNVYRACGATPLTTPHKGVPLTIQIPEPEMLNQPFRDACRSFVFRHFPITPEHPSIRNAENYTPIRESVSWTGMRNLLGIGERVSGTLGNATYLGGFILFTLFWIAILFRETQLRNARLVLGAIAVFHLIILAFTGTRGASLGLGAGIFIVALWHALIRLRPFHIQTSLYKNYALWTLLAIIITPMIIFSTREAPIWQMLPITRQLTANIFETASLRFSSWDTAINAIKERPLFGWGHEGYIYAFDRYYNPIHYGEESWFDRVHNVFLDYAIAGGLVLLISYLSIFILFFTLLIRRAQTEHVSLIAAMGVAYLVQGMTLFDILPISIPLGIFLAYSIHTITSFRSPEFRTSKNITQSVPQPYLIAGISILVIATSLYFTSYLPFKTNKLILEGLRIGTHDATRAVELLRQAIESRSPIGAMEARNQLALFGHNYIGELAQQNMRLDATSLSGLMAVINTHFQEVLKRGTPLSSKEMYTISIVNFRAGLVAQDPTLGEYYLKTAEKYLTDGLSIAPTRIELILELMKIASVRGDTDQLERLAQRVSELRPNDALDILRRNHLAN